MAESHCTLLRIRAGIFLQPDCLSSLVSYLNFRANVKLIIHALPHDFLPVKEFVTALNAVGKESVLLDLPQVALEKIRTLSGFPAIPNTNRYVRRTYFCEMRRRRIIIKRPLPSHVFFL